MRNKILSGLPARPGMLLIVALTLIAVASSPVVVAAQSPREADTAEPVHLVVQVNDGGEVRINRMDWDVNAFAPVSPGAGVRASDYVDLSGRTTIVIVCTDLTLIDQRGSEVPRCDPYPADPAFYYLDDPAWLPPEGPVVVATSSSTQVPEGVNPSGINFDELTGGDLDRVSRYTQSILGLSLADDARAFTLASFYRSAGMTFDALNVLTALPGLGCGARRPTVELPAGSAVTLATSPVTYLRIGELYQLLGMNEDALRNYRCAADLSELLQSPADRALAFARQANVVDQPNSAVQFYQIAINGYADLGAMDNATAMAEICGLRNCTLPQ